VKKIIFVILPLLLLSFLLAKPSIAGPKVIPGTTPVITGPNPGPPVGVTCGNTMCLPGEVCIKYPQDLDLHCVAQSIIDDPITPIGNDPDVPEDCWKQLGSQNGIFPPNSACWNHFQNTQVDIFQYERTCIYEPVVRYSADRFLNSLTPEKDQPFTMCGIGESGPGGPPAPGGGNFDCTVSMLVYTDVREAETGSYGPSVDAEASYSADFIAQNYLYTSLFGRPMDLSAGYDPQNTAGNHGRPTREAYRTYWRLLPASNQANLRSFVLNMADKDQIDNIIFNFTDRNGLDKKTSFKKLYNALSKQVILFWHWPFVRVGCLTDYPVCPEYAQATQSLKPTFQDLREMATELDLGWLVDASIGLYETAISAFGGDLDGPYAAFVPLDFNSTRSYIVKKKDEFEEEMYFKDPWYNPRLIDQYNSGRYGTNKPGLTNVSRESVPYVGAIYQGLLSPKFGMLPALQPQWIIDKYASPRGISDYRIGNTPLSLPEVKLAQKGFLERIEEEAVAIISNPLGWLWNKVNNLFTDDELKKVGYTENEIDNLNGKVKDGYYNVACPLPVSYHLMAPKTAAGHKGDPNQIPADDHHQVISIAGDKLAWNYNPECRPPDEKEVCDIYGNNCHTEYDSCPINDWAGKYKDPGSGMCCTRKWSVEGIKHGKTLNILNNPKQTDIKEAVVNNDQYSFYKMMLPDGIDKTVDASIDAPIARNFVSYRGLGVNAGNTATAPNGNSEILNPAEPINRVNNLAQDSMHILQNCWAVPKALQNSPRCVPLPTPTQTPDSCTGEAFKKIDPNPTRPSAKAENYFNSNIKTKLDADKSLTEAYAKAEEQTGVPCEVLAGIHFEEANNDPTLDLQSGASLGGRSLTESAVAAAEELLEKAGGSINNMTTLIKALSYYNGGGNQNCQSGGSNNCASTNQCGMTVACATDTTCATSPGTCACNCNGGVQEPGSCRATCASGFPYQFNYTFCAPKSIGYDDPYVTNWWISPEHDTMYLLYTYDCTATTPTIHDHPGSLTAAISLFLSEK